MLAFTFWLPRNKSLIFSLSILVVSYHTWKVFPFWSQSFFQTDRKVQQESEMNVFYANLNSQNKQKGELIRYLENAKPELVLLVETNRAWFEKLKTLESIYPFTKAILRESNFGMTVLSQYPLSTEKVYVDKENLIPALWLKVNTSAGPLGLFLLHVYPPLGKYGTLVRNQHLVTLSKEIADINSPLLVCGDFNTTPWSTIFQKFLSHSNLELSKRYSMFNTWSAVGFLPGLPIDFCLSKGISITSYSKGPDIGSDHWPLILKITGNARDPASDQSSPKAEN